VKKESLKRRKLKLINLMEWFTGKRECITCGEKFPFKEREQVFVEQGMDSETDIDLLTYCSNKCAILDRDAMMLHDLKEYEIKKFGYITEETKLKMIQLSRRIKYG